VPGELHTGPLSWNGVEDQLPSGIDEAIRAVVDGRRQGLVPNTLCALAAEIAPAARGRSPAEETVRAMASLARTCSFAHLIAPVRPPWKDRYPLTPIERYVRWRRPDGTLLDPWLRVHERLGGRLSSALPRSMRITGSVGEWEAWTDTVFPENGEYVLPAGLATVAIDREADLGSCWEPNVWVVDEIRDARS